MADWDRSGVDDPPPTAAAVYAQMAIGCAATFVLHLLAGLLLLALAAGASVVGSGAGGQVVGAMLGLAYVGVFAIGLSQWVYLTPIAALVFVRRRPLALGLIIGGMLTVLLNTSCFAILLTSSW